MRDRLGHGTLPRNIDHDLLHPTNKYQRNIVQACLIK